MPISPLQRQTISLGEAAQNALRFCLQLVPFQKPVKLFMEVKDRCGRDGFVFRVVN